MSFSTLMQRMGLLKAQPLDGEQLGGGTTAAPAAETPAPAAAADATAAPGAAAEPEKTGGEPDGTTAAAGSSDDVLVKSMTVEVDGNEYVAYDGEELAKSMNMLHAEHKALRAEHDGTKAELKSALDVVGHAVDLIEEQRAVLGTMNKSLASQAVTIEAQTTQLSQNDVLIKSLRADLDAVRNEPAGRRSVASPAQPGATNDLIKSFGKAEGGEQSTMERPEFMAKCLELQKSGQLTFEEVISAEAYLNSGMEVPEQIRKKVFSK